MTQPRIVSISMIKNEQDIVEPFLRHNARLVDCMVVLDNSSVDRTRRIALECARELGNVVLTDSGEFAYHQAERLTMVLHRAQSAFFADYVVFLDADEFLSAPDRSSLRTALEKIPSGGVGLVPWRTFVLKPGEDRARKDPPRDMRWRRSAEQPQYWKAILRLDGTYRPDLQMARGNHDAASSDKKPLPRVKLEGLALLHFPVRSRRQLVAKTIVGCMAYLAKDRSAKVTAYQWREAFDRVMSDPRAFEGEELCEASMQYAQQQRPATDWSRDIRLAEPPSAYERRYSNGSFAEPLQLVARSWQQSLTPPRTTAVRRPPMARGAAKRGSTSFDANWHWDHLYVDKAPFRYIAEKYRPREVLDVGCGIGSYPWLFKKYGAATVMGVDGIPAEATVLGKNEYLQHDLSQRLELDGQYDLVICSEVLEHLPPADADRLLQDLDRLARRFVLFSAATPGQPGNGHIHCQPISYWLERWARLGWIPSLLDTMGLRCLSTMSWLQHNLVLLVRGDASEGADAMAVLGELGSRPFKWYEQAPGIREEAFAEPLPTPPAGYRPAG